VIVDFAGLLKFTLH